MALSSLPNPVHSTTVNFPLSKLDEAVRKISVVDKKFKLINANPAFNQYIFEASEFLSMGANVVIDLNEITPQKTEIKMEVRRIMGTFNQPYEVQRAYKHIDKLLKVIAELVTSDTNILNTERENLDSKNRDQRSFKSLFITDENAISNVNIKWYNNFGWMVFWSILFFPVALFGLLKSTMSSTKKIIIGILSILFLFSYSQQIVTKGENNEILAQSQNSEDYNFKILSKKSVGNMVNINVSTSKEFVSKSEMRKAASKLLELYCQSEKCNVISLWKDAEIYKLYDDIRTESEEPKWMKKNWKMICENLIFDYNVNVNELLFYPFIDETYRKYGGKMKKPE